MAEKNDVNSDLHYLNLLSIFHYVVGGIKYVFGCIPIIHLVIGLVFLFAPLHSNKGEELPMALMGGFFVVFALAFITMSWTLATMMLIVGYKLGRRKSYMFCLVIACIECISMPFGTILGVFTIILLSRPSVKALFNPPTAVNSSENPNIA